MRFAGLPMGGGSFWHDREAMGLADDQSNFWMNVDTLDFEGLHLEPSAPTFDICDTRGGDDYLHVDVSNQNVNATGRIDATMSSYRLLEIISDKQDLSFVDKVLVSEEQIAALCNALLPGSACLGPQGQLVELSFASLDALNLNVVGLYGDKLMITQILNREKALSPQMLESMSDDSLKPGLYASLGENLPLYLFYWPGCKQWQLTNGQASRKDVACNFIRYLMELCGCVYACLQGESIQPVMKQCTTSVPCLKKQRTQRLQISLRKESEDDIKLLRGFNITLPSDLVADDNLVLPVPSQLSGGLHRLAVLSPVLNRAKLVSRRKTMEKFSRDVEQHLRSLSSSFNVDCTALADEDFLRLLEVSHNENMLREYRKTRDEWQRRLEESKERMSSNFVQAILKSSEDEIVQGFQDAVSPLLMQKFPWEESMFWRNGLHSQVDQERLLVMNKYGNESDQAVLDAVCSVLSTLENKICCFLSGQPGGRLLFAGEKVEIFDASGKQSHGIYTISHAADNRKGSQIKAGVICAGQHVILESEKDGRSKYEFHLHPNSGVKSTNREPMIMNADVDTATGLYLQSVFEHQSCPFMGTVQMKQIGNTCLYMKDWLDALCSEKIPCLERKAAAASFLMEELGSELTVDKKIIVTLLSSEHRDWSDLKLFPNSIRYKISKLLLNFFDCPTPDAAYVIHEQVAVTALELYEVARNALWDAIRIMVVKDLCPLIKCRKERDFQNEAAAAQNKMETELHSVLQEMKLLLSKSSLPSLDTARKVVLRSLEQRTRGFKDSFKTLLMRGYEVKLLLAYDIEEMDNETVTWKAVELVPEKKDLEKLMTSAQSSHILIPTCSKAIEIITLDPSKEILKKVVYPRTGQALIFLEAKDKSYLHMYVCPKLSAPVIGRNPERVFKRGVDLVAIDEISRFMAMFDRSLLSVQFFRFDEFFQHLDWTGLDLQLSEFVGSSSIVWMEFVPGKRELVLIDDQSRVRIFELVPAMMKPRHLTLPEPFLKACITPDATCLMVFTCTSCDKNTCTSCDKNLLLDASHQNSSETQPFSPALSAHIYLLGDSLAYLKRVDLHPLPSGLDIIGLQADCKYFGPQMHLVIKLQTLTLVSQVLEISSASQAYQLQKVGTSNTELTISDNSDRQAPGSSCPALEYIFHAYDKYACSPPLCSFDKIIRLCVLVNPPNTNWDEIVTKQRCTEHVSLTLKKLKEKGKDFSKLDIQLFVDIYNEEWSLGKSQNSVSLGKWIRQLVCLVPLQVARAENNSLKPLINGLQIPADAVYADAVSLANLLRFGIYDVVLSDWKGNVKVISSMGKQSSGKSYLLNHLAGSFLDVAGGRCTDGVWMTISCTVDCLYVLLDFEGLGSFERSEQEDMLLSILNAAISNVTIFNKKDFHLDKETEAIFQRFQDGVSLVKADQKLFKGLFYMAIKDVDASDVDDLKVEFFAKIQHICNKSQENFLTTMYRGELEIAAMPPFQRPEFHSSITNIAETIEELAPIHYSGRSFITDLKLVIAQISARDWSPLDSKRLIMRLSLLKKHLNGALRVGNCLDGMPLVDFDTQEQISDEPICLSGYTFTVKDAGLELIASPDANKAMGSILQPLKDAFQEVVHRKGNDETWLAMYDTFLASLLARRKARILAWLSVNTKDFSEEGDVQKLRLEVNAALSEMRSRLVVCSCKCKECFLKCILEKGHPSSEHSCLTGHSCVEECTYCLEECRDQQQLGCTNLTILQCKDLAGHDGAHDCKRRMHTCEMPCVFSAKASNCNLSCSLRRNHEGDHRCNSRQHQCKMKCSLPSCKNVCVIPFELGEHERHVCHERFCSMQCSMEGCTRTCVTEDHFHQLQDRAEHYCAGEHPCAKKCENPGICNVLTELLKQTRSFHGKRGDFDYEYISEQTEERKGCCLMIPPFKKAHDGPHMHTTNVNAVHFCNTRCPACAYYCQLPFGHAGLHKTPHGNMSKMKFVSEDEDIDVLDRKYARGESGMAEMCMMHCKARSRGHTHLVPCPGAQHGGHCTEKLYDGSRHVTEKCSGLDKDVPLDEMTHETYWEYIRFADPCEEVEKASFAMCGHFCRSEEHLQGSSSTSVVNGKSYCTEKLWHAPVPRSGAYQHGSGGYTTEDGHHFACDHSRHAPHNVIFVIDKSGSMESTDIAPSMAKFINSGHSNRLGCVYEAIVRFIKTRLQSTSLQSERDMVSVVLFDNYGIVATRLQELSENLVDQLLSYWAGGGTTYSAGLQQAEEILSAARGDTNLDKKSPVVIFLSDGGNNGGTDPVYMVCKLKQQEPRLVVHTIMFGNDPYAGILKEMAKAGDGTFQKSLDEVQLAKSFEDLAKSLKPKLAALCSSCD